MAVAGVRKNEPATIVAMKGKPKSAKGCFVRRDRYRAAMVFASADERNFLLEKTAMLMNGSVAVVSGER